TKREITSSTSKGYKIQAIEKEIANLDKWQNHAAFEDPEGIQRIRGLAGSGKTVVLAKKAAYLHFQYPEWKIAVTFYTRSLGQQFYDMINMFYKEYSDEPINEDKLQILHAWGAGTEIGVYSEVCHNLGIVPENYNLALQKYGRNREFQGAISGIINLVSESYPHKYDAIIIDEAQDMP
ncbi:DEAD/DEAH box helicase family protein, partial [Staphylococcus aureus]|uniref:DEAD/DEAH box helicase family protein n=3 Tax=Bacilli TaxID=91061 RepID=UPI000BDA868A